MDIAKEVKDFATQRRGEFPIFSRYPNWTYLDSAATAQKSQQLIDFLHTFWRTQNAPLHRGVYTLSAQVTQAYEEVRGKVASFLGTQLGDAPLANEIVFCKGTTEAINLVAHSFVAPRLQAGDNIVISAMEHHANFVPWQQLCQQTSAQLRVIPLQITQLEGAFNSHLQCRLDLNAAEALLDKRTRFMAISHVSNVLGTINPVAQLCQLAKAKHIPVLIDGAQAVVHRLGQSLQQEVEAVACDFYTFSAHKLYGPDGVGVLYGRRELLEAMQPYQTGGDMIEFVSAKECSFAPPPQRFEAGTMPVSAVLGLGKALDYFCSLPQNVLQVHESQLLQMASDTLRNSPEFGKIRIIGDETTLDAKVGVISFVIDGVHPHDAGSIFDSANVAVRAGHHCAQPLMAYLGLTATVRASLALYNNEHDIQQLCTGLNQVIQIMLG